MAFARTVAHATAADGSFSAAGTAAWDGTGAHTPAVVDAVSGGIPYFSSTTTEGTSALLAAGGLVVGGGAGTAPLTYANLTYSSANERLTVGTGATTSAGVIAGYSGSSQYSGIWHTNVSPSSANYGVRLYSDASGGSTSIGSNSTQTNTNSSVVIAPANSTKMAFYGTAGYGPDITAGTATSAVSALTITGTINFNTSAINWVDWTLTDTSSHANTLAWRVRGGASGTTALASLTKAGKLEAVSYRVNGSDGVSFGPSAVASITVVNGIITAIS